MSHEKERDILEQLKAVRRLKGYSYQDIADMTSEMGQAVSISSIKRVFAPDSDLESFRYDTTIQPIADVVLGIEDKDADPGEGSKHGEEDYMTIEALKKIIEIKNETINTMQTVIDEKSETLDVTRKEYQKGVADRNRTIRNLSIALFAMIAIVVGILLLDFAIGSIGWFRR